MPLLNLLLLSTFGDHLAAVAAIASNLPNLPALPQAADAAEATSLSFDEIFVMIVC